MSKMKFVVVDLETFGLIPGSAIRSIGACFFRPKAIRADDATWEENIGERFYSNVSLESCREVGLTTQPSTEAWWLEQDKKAQQALLVDQVSLTDACVAFARWFSENGGQEYWANGANFDGPILEACYRAVGMDAPWTYYHSRCCRTIYDMGRVRTKEVPFKGTPHNALDDAVHQARCIMIAAGNLFGVGEG